MVVKPPLPLITAPISSANQWALCHLSAVCASQMYVRVKLEICPSVFTCRLTLTCMLTHRLPWVPCTSTPVTCRYSLAAWDTSEEHVAKHKCLCNQDLPRLDEQSIARWSPFDNALALAKCCFCYQYSAQGFNNSIMFTAAAHYL